MGSVDMSKTPAVQIMAVWVKTDKWYCAEESKLRDFFDELLRELQLTIVIPPIGVRLPIVNFTDQYGRSPKPPSDLGVSMITLIAESHIALHTWPEFELAFLEICSCKFFDEEIVENVIKAHFPTPQISKRGLVFEV